MRPAGCHHPAWIQPVVEESEGAWPPRLADSLQKESTTAWLQHNPIASTGPHDSPAIHRCPPCLEFSQISTDIPVHQGCMGSSPDSILIGYRLPPAPAAPADSKHATRPPISPCPTAEGSCREDPLSGDRAPERGLRRRISRESLPVGIPTELSQQRCLKVPRLSRGISANQGLFATGNAFIHSLPDSVRG